MSDDTPSPLNNVITIDDERIKSHLDRVVRGTVEETLNALLDKRPGGAAAGADRKMNNEPLEREPLYRVRARLEALLKANAAPRCGARSNRRRGPRI